MIVVAYTLLVNRALIVPQFLTDGCQVAPTRDVIETKGAVLPFPVFSFWKMK